MRDPEQGGAAQRRRLRLAAPEPQRRRRRRPAPAVPVRRGHDRTDDRAVALLRPARLPAELRRPDEQHQHARDVRRRRPGRQGTRTERRGPAGDRRRADARVPDGHPRPAERPRAGSSTTSSRAPSSLREITILDISDCHAQLTPLAEAADNARGAGRQPVLRDRRLGVPQAVVRHLRGRVRARATTAERHRGGRRRLVRRRTPPISNFFGDKPTPPIMKMMGIDVDALGNHNFDRGADVPADAADPARRLPDALGERRLPERQDAGGVVAVDGVHVRDGVEARRRRLHDRVDARASSSRATLDPFQVAARRAGGQRRGGEARQARPTRSSRSATRARPAGTVDRPDRARSIDIADSVPNVDVGDRRPQRPPGRLAARRTACS